MDKRSNLPELLTIRQVAKMIKIHPETLRRWDKSGRLRSIRVGSRRDRRYGKEDIERFIKYLEREKDKR